MIDRITILGGSSVYTPEFILSLISSNLNVKEIVLLGRPGPKLPLVAKFCQRLINKSGFPATVIGTTDLEEGVSGAKFILNHIRVGGMQARQRDESLPAKYGLIGDESLGAGGFSNAMRTLPVVLDMAAKIERVNPRATFINLTNPTGIVVEALNRYSSLNVLGVCDLPGVYIKKVAEVLRHEPSALEFDYIGLNHMGWIQDVRFSGRSLMGRLLERLEHHGNDGFDYPLIELFHMIPTREISLFFHKDEILKRQQVCARSRAQLLYEAEKQILKLYEDEHITEIPELTRARNPIWYGETIIPLMKASENAEEKDFVLCVRNEASIRDLPPDASVEIPVRVSKKGMTKSRVGDCPHFLKGLFMSTKESDRLTVDAVRHKSYDLALQALTINPLVSSLDTARRYLDRITKEEGLELH